jgi:tRNA(Ile)-lysidine synthase
MLENRDTVIIGVSGGADSMCLLLFLNSIKHKFDLTLKVIHVNHLLRGSQSDKDEDFVVETCKSWGIRCEVFRVDVADYAKKNKISEEEAGRDIRRGIFENSISQSGKTAIKIALAHQENDLAETVLMNLCRGSNIDGLAGILPVSGRYIRPLLCVGRKEIEKYLAGLGVIWREDSSNSSDKYLRNRIRNRIIPELNELVNAKSTEHIAGTARVIAGLSGFLQDQIRDYVLECRAFEKNGEIAHNAFNIEMFNKVPEFLKSFVLMEILSEATGKKKDLSAAHIKALEALTLRQTGARLGLPYALEAIKEYDRIRFYKTDREIKFNENVNQDPAIDEINALFNEIYTEDKSDNFKNDSELVYTNRFDCAIMNRHFYLRHRENGDFIVISRDGVRQRLSRFFINTKIPQSERDDLWVLADGNEVLWILGIRESYAYKVTDETEKIAEIKAFLPRAGNESDIAPRYEIVITEV